jgi:hypothetical protein
MLSDQSVYITGEEVWVDGYLSGDKTESKTIMLRLADRKGVTKTWTPLLIDQNQFSGIINLPETLATDYYFLDAWILSGKTETLLVPLMVINPRMPFDKDCEANTANNGFIQNSEKFKIDLSKNAIEKREEIAITFSGENKLALNQWSVIREDALSQLINKNARIFNTTVAHAVPASLEKEGHVIGVRVRSEGKPLAGLKILAALKGKKAIVGTATSDANGIARFILPINTGKTELSFTAITNNSNSLVFESLVEEVEAKPISFPCLLLQEDMRADIEARIFNSRVANKFQQDGIKYFAALDMDSTDFYGKPDSRYLLDEFVRFPNMEEVIAEIIPDVRIKKEGNKTILQSLNIPTRSFFNEEALILLDGTPLNKTKELLESDPLLIRSIEVVSRKYSLGNLEFSGIVHFKTYKGDMGSFKNSTAEKNISFLGVQETAIHQSPQFAKEKLPDFRNVIARDKNIRFDESGKSTIKFKSSDAEGMYRVVFKGFYLDGTPIQVSTSFQVQ